MRPWLPAILSTLLLLTALTPGAAVLAGETRPAARTSATDPDGWPDTPAARIARGWVEAFNGGEAAMRGWLSRNLTPSSLEKKPLPERMEVYRTNRERWGRLVFASVEKSAPAELTVKLLDADANAIPFTFSVEDRPPYRLVSITLKQMHGHPGFGH